MLITGLPVGTFFGALFGLLRSEELHSKAKLVKKKIICYKTEKQVSTASTLNEKNALDITFGSVSETSPTATGNNYFFTEKR